MNATISVNLQQKNYTIDITKNQSIGKETDPTVPEWAKQPDKPTYTASEIGAVPDENILTNMDIYNILMNGE